LSNVITGNLLTGFVEQYGDASQLSELLIHHVR
jgi:hypothetical protein